MFVETLIKVLEFIVSALQIKNAILRLLVEACMAMIPSQKTIIQYVEEPTYYYKEEPEESDFKMLETEVLPKPNLDKVPEEYDPYQCTLAPKFREIASADLREDDTIRAQALTQMREWIAKHPHIKKCRTDAVFLLRFLRTKKFSIPAACEILERYMTVRQIYPHWFQKLDIEDPDIEGIITSGYLVPLLERDDHGRQVILSCAGKFDTSRYTSAQMARAHSLVCEVLLDDEENQVAGYTHINDESGLTMSILSLWSLVDLKNMLKCIQNSTPMRHRETHFINLPPFAMKFIDFGMSIISEKLKNRVVLHKSLDELKAKVNPKILPKEYGGTVPMAEMIEQFKAKCRRNRLKILALDDMHIEITKNSPYWQEVEDNEIDSGMCGSFRKLQVD
ncbi:clavesin-2 [Culicoides brevitarsis]|uniref:clavesin-2 n=1 Tax=Culicoides brevitarsis TaxID=469753 RepID=UPI00307B1199